MQDPNEIALRKHLQAEEDARDADLDDVHNNVVAGQTKQYLAELLSESIGESLTDEQMEMLWECLYDFQPINSKNPLVVCSLLKKALGRYLIAVYEHTEGARDTGDLLKEVA